MKTLPNNFRVVLAATALTVLFAAGCERRAPEDTTGTAPIESPATEGVSPAPVMPETSPAAPAPITGTEPYADAAKSAGETVDDTVTTTKVKTALLADSDIKGLDVSVETEKNIVTLSGEVNNQTQIDRAVKLAGEVSGVASVVNHLTIKP